MTVVLTVDCDRVELLQVGVDGLIARLHFVSQIIDCNLDRERLHSSGDPTADTLLFVQRHLRHRSGRDRDGLRAVDECVSVWARMASIRTLHGGSN